MDTDDLNIGNQVVIEEIKKRTKEIVDLIVKVMDEKDIE